jgi:two-component system sensor histidine kinase KdpD
VDFAHAENATQLMLGATSRSRLRELSTGSVINRVIRQAGPVDVHVIPTRGPEALRLPHPPRRRRPAVVPLFRRWLAALLATVGVGLLAAALSPAHATLGLPGALLCLLLAVVGVALIGGLLNGLLATVVATLCGDFFFTEPRYSLRIAHTVDVVAVFAFLAAATVMTLLIDRLARRGVQTARAEAEARALARLAGESMLAAPPTPRTLVAQLRRTFGLDAVAVLTRIGSDDDAWHPVAVAGADAPARPEDAAFTAELDENTVLVLGGHPSTPRTPDCSAHSSVSCGWPRSGCGSRPAPRQPTGWPAPRPCTPPSSSRSRTTCAPRSPPSRPPRPACCRRRSTGRRRTCSASAPSSTTRRTPSANSSPNCSTIPAWKRAPSPSPCPPVGVAELLHHAVDRLPEHGTGVRMDLTQPLPPALADPQLLLKAFDSVLRNALYWSPDGTPVRVETGADERLVRVQVSDEGPGVDPALRERIFLPFQGGRLRPDSRTGSGGLGLGLSVAHGFTRAMGADLTVEDGLGHGAAFVFTLRRARS